MRLNIFVINLGVIILMMCGASSLFAENNQGVFQERRDPFVPLVDSEGNIRTLKDVFRPISEMLPIKLELKGIIMGGQQPLAIINDKLYNEGSKIVEGLFLEEINSDNVLLDYGGRKLKLEIRKMEKDRE